MESSSYERVDGESKASPFVGVVNPRKRGREAPVSVSGSPDNLFSPQPQHQSSTSMLVNLSLLNNQQHQGGVVSTGLGLCFEDQQQQQQHHQKLQQQQLGLLFPSPVPSSLGSDISAQIKQQRDEINQLLQTHVPKSPSLFWVIALFPFHPLLPSSVKS
ncbi:hypothetical protein AAC387_Pa02g4690 [Persea americana]